MAKRNTESIKLPSPPDLADLPQEANVGTPEKSSNGPVIATEVGAPDCLPRDATEEEIHSLRHVIDKIPFTVWLVAFTGAASQFGYYGVTIPWQNYMQNPGGNPLAPGALGLGQSKATTINNVFLFFTYLTPLPFAAISDAWIGRYSTVLVSLGLLVVGCIVLFGTSLPNLHSHGAGVGGLVTAVLLVGLGRGAQKAVLYPFLGDQLPERQAQVTRTKKGELVIADRTLTVQYIFNVYYWMVNVAGLSSLATTFMEKYIGFWAAYLLPTCFLLAAIIPLIIWHSRLIKLRPAQNVLPVAIKVLFLAIRSRFSLSAALPSHQLTQYSRRVPWTRSFVLQLRRGLLSCRVTLFSTTFYLCYNQVLNNIISQAGQMTTGFLSNDTIQSLNPIACIILGPIIQNLLFPFLRKRGIAFGPIARIAVAFFFTALALAYAAVLQSLIYASPPCFRFPRACPASLLPDNQHRPNEISVWAQTPFHFLLGVGEILGLVSLSEYTFALAPLNMKAVVQAFQQLTAALASALGMALGSVSKDPWLVIMYACLAGAMGVTGLVFWMVFWRENAKFGSESGDDADTDEEREAEVEVEGAVENREGLADVKATETKKDVEVNVVYI
ncbi:MAG: peptide transporter ptr2 [Bathelium mastoideum]|nr:MAG: peptide transporter ptr2 [Bathelium mastoideum]